MVAKREDPEMVQFINLVTDYCKSGRYLTPPKISAFIEGSIGLVRIKTLLAPTGQWWKKCVTSGWVAVLGSDGKPWKSNGNRWSRSQRGIRYVAGRKMFKLGTKNRKPNSQVLREFRQWLGEAGD